MDRKQIEQWAREADPNFGWHVTADTIVGMEELERFAALVAAHEREQCAVAANEFLTKGRSPHGTRVAAAIRARDATKPAIS